MSTRLLSALEELLAPPSLCRVPLPRMLVESRPGHRGGPFGRLAGPGLCVPSNGEARTCKASELFLVSLVKYAEQPLLSPDPQSPPRRDQSRDPSAVDVSLPVSGAHSPLSQVWERESRAASKRELFPPGASHDPRQEMGRCAYLKVHGLALPGCGKGC